MPNNGNLVRTIEIKDRQGRVIATEDVVTYAGLLSLAHDQGLKRIETTLVQLPGQANGQTAVFTAVIETEHGLFKGHGDANPENVSSRIVPHIIRMAETRAKARALRDAVNIGIVAVEELALEGNGSYQSGPDPNGGDNQRIPGVSSRRSVKGGGKATAEESPPEMMTEAQRRYLFRLLAERQVPAEKAEGHLLDICGVKSLKEITKQRASDLIEELLQMARPAAEVPF